MDELLAGPAVLYEHPDDGHRTATRAAGAPSLGIAGDPLVPGPVAPASPVPRRPGAPDAGGRLLHDYAPDDPLRALLGPGAAIDRILERVRQVTDSAAPILIQGESGTGKEILARAIHLLGPRRRLPFIVLDCGGLPGRRVGSGLSSSGAPAPGGGGRPLDGRLRLAGGGTLFLEDVTSLPWEAQARLARLLGEGGVPSADGRRTVPIEARIIASCRVPLESRVLGLRFRQDLYERLSTFSVSLPPLRGRVEDVLYLAGRFLVEASREFRRPVVGVAEDAARRLASYRWPGNVRELRSVIRQAVLEGAPTIGMEHLPARISRAGAIPQGASPEATAGELAGAGAAPAAPRGARAGLSKDREYARGVARSRGSGGSAFPCSGSGRRRPPPAPSF
jgi:DNA-binding NtrC family response regulator